MVSAATARFHRLPTPAKLLLILTAAILPVGILLTLLAESGISQANDALHGRAEDQARTASQAVESLIARNALALRIAANGALRDPSADPCGRAMNALAVSPGVARSFGLRRSDGTLICTAGGFQPVTENLLIAPGDIRLWVSPDRNSIFLRVGVIGGTAIGMLSRDELRSAVADAIAHDGSFAVRDGFRELDILNRGSSPGAGNSSLSFTDLPIANGQLVARVGLHLPRVTAADKIALLLPVLMWVLAALITWFLVSRLLIRPLRRLQQAVGGYQPGDELDLPRNLGPATEIEDLRNAFGRALARVDESERNMATALDGQRRLVREVHHRVKNNLQVVASLLNIHGRSAQALEARAAYASIGRRVGALSMVHRNHFAELEESRGIALRPLLSELAAELRAGAPESARSLAIDLDLESANTTQDVAVAAAFLVTEIVEYAMLYCPAEAVEVSLRRTSELTARLGVASPVLIPDDAARPDKVQFERIIAGLAKQLRSTLERKLGRYSVELPVFPAA